MYDKALLGALGVAGTSYAAYKLLFPWMALDAVDIAVSDRIVAAITETFEKRVYVVDAFERHVAEQPDKYFLIYNDRLYTYEQVDRRANKVARAAMKWGLSKGDVVAMYMNNGPDFVWTVLGLWKIGLATSLLNINITHRPLVHCLQVSKAKAVIISGDQKLIQAVIDIIPDAGDLPIFVHDFAAADLPACCSSLSELLALVSDEPTDKNLRLPVDEFGPVCFVFTSGTTGLPKAAILSNVKSMLFLAFLKAQIALGPDDRLYCCLPMFHSSAFFIGFLNILGVGGTFVIAKSFSASQFWVDCRKHRATGFLYIGELCRYLLTKPEDPRDGEHSLRFAYGNGLRKDIWGKFQTRFKIPKIYEFFGATEGPIGFLNNHNKIGAVGRYSPYMAWKEGNTRVLVKFDLATAEPIRGKNGQCIKVKVGEPGLLLGAFPEFIKPQVYAGDKALSEKKVVRNVLKKGDVYFNFGDVLYYDKDYFVYFADRIGDTFRWKGENVSTLEVANVLSNLDFILDANVYGVAVPGHEGRAGMVSLVLKDGCAELNKQMCKSIYKCCKEDLPKYARPLFLRVQQNMVLTATHKQRKVELVKEGFDIAKISEPVYFLDESVENYVPLTEQKFRTLSVGNSKL